MPKRSFNYTMISSLGAVHERHTSMRQTPAGQPDMIEPTAAKFVERHGADALRILDERAETALQLGHKIAASTWREIADAAAGLLGVEQPASPHPPDAQSP